MNATLLSSLEPSKIFVGSTNQVKVSAVREVIEDYPALAQAEVIGLTVSSGVSDQPISLEETIQGAKNRAEQAFQTDSISVGVEGGLMKIPAIDDEFIHISVCSIFDGKQHHLGFASGFRIPKAVSTLIVEEGLDLNQAMKKCGFTENPQLGASEGTIGLFTNGRLPRKAYCKQSLITALISIDQPQFFDGSVDSSERGVLLDEKQELILLESSS